MNKQTLRERIAGIVANGAMQPMKSANDILAIIEQQVTEGRLIELDLLEQALNEGRDIEQYKLQRLAALTEEEDHD